MIESGANRMDCKFVRTTERALQTNTDPRMRGHMIFSENLSIAFMGKKAVPLNQSWAVGFSILEVSKYIMFWLMYNAIKPAFKDRVGVILSDTDSWILSLPTKTSEEAVSVIRGIMDFSNYPPTHPLYDERVKNRTGYLKNEIPDCEIREVVGLRSKTYAIKTRTNSTTSRVKGVKKAAKEKIPFAAFKKCIRQVCELQVEQYSIQSKKHVNRLMRCKKIAFSSFDDKRHLLCAIHSVPYGSVLIQSSIEAGICHFCANPHLFC